MEIELREIRDFIVHVPPFDILPEKELNQLVHSLVIRYLRRGKRLFQENEKPARFFIIRTGAISLLSTDKTIICKFAEGDICTDFCIADNNKNTYAIAAEDTLLYSIPCAELFEVTRNIPQIKSFILHSSSQRLNDAIKENLHETSKSATLMNTPLKVFYSSEVINIDIEASIKEASQKMNNYGVSSLLILHSGKLAGIITDRDIRARCVAEGLATSESVKKIMTPDPIHVCSDIVAFDGLMVMTKNNIHHLPIMDDDHVCGIVTATDLMRHEVKNTVHISRLIHRATSVAALAEISLMIPDIQQQMVSIGGSARHVGKAITTISDAICCRLIEMAEEDLGSPPVDYAWIAAGSQARNEQSSHSDQDNGLIISDRMVLEHASWFTMLADFVCDGLDACGFVHCPGNAMAKNPQWRQTESIWTGYYKKWISTPEPKALMLSSIFFDVRVVHGKKSLLSNIQKTIFNLAKSNQLFLAHMTANSLQHRTPLGFFRDFVLVDDGEHKDMLDLKHNGIVPIIDLARIYALAEGLDAVNTASRLKGASGSPSLSKDGAANLLDAFEFISNLRFEHQAEQIRKGELADNFLSPKSLSRLQRVHLKDAFKAVKTMQDFLSHYYHADQF